METGGGGEIIEGLENGLKEFMRDIQGVKESVCVAQMLYCIGDAFSSRD